jgi:hypothetical protein
MSAASSCTNRRLLGHAARGGLLVAALVFAALLGSALPAFAGQAASGQLLFYPCTSCHPVTEIPGTEKSSRPLPGGFEGHAIVLEGHDALGKGHAACPVCHDDMTRNPGKLKTADGSLVDIKGDVALVCYRCHSTKYKEWKAGTHGKHLGKCTAAGCHDPHTPGFIYAGPSMPFTGTGFQFKVLSKREPFMPLASPAPPPLVEIPAWFFGVVALGVVVAGGLAGSLAYGRLKR